ncbi:MAG: YqaE/Pmp3 family membrane protein [Chitinophagales bacterium]
MSILRILASVFVPPLAVVDKGIGNFLIVLICSLFGHIPGTIAALVILINDKNEDRKYATA